MAISSDPQVDKFIKSLEIHTTAKVLRTLDLLETFGGSLTMPHSKKIARDLFELRVRGRQEVRIFYTFYQGNARLLHAFIKKDQKTPRKEIQQALAKLKGLDLI